jgi:hypothetical protein
MPFKPGISGNPGGRKKAIGLSDAVRASEGLKTWSMLLQIRDSKIREQVIEDGEVVDVVPSIKERLNAIKLILAYTWGNPVQVGTDELERRIIELEEQIKQVGSWARH